MRLADKPLTLALSTAGKPERVQQQQEQLE